MSKVYLMKHAKIDLKEQVKAQLVLELKVCLALDGAIDDISAYTVC